MKTLTRVRLVLIPARLAASGFPRWKRHSGRSGVELATKLMTRVTPIRISTG